MFLHALGLNRNKVIKYFETCFDYVYYLLVLLIFRFFIIFFLFLLRVLMCTVWILNQVQGFHLAFLISKTQKYICLIFVHFGIVNCDRECDFNNLYDYILTIYSTLDQFITFILKHAFSIFCSDTSVKNLCLKCLTSMYFYKKNFSGKSE